MGILDRFFGCRSQRGGTAASEPGMHVVPLADRTPERTLAARVIDDDDGERRNRQREIAGSEIGDEVVLAFEARPRPQPNAIAVWSTRTGGQLGHLPLDMAAYIALHTKRHDFRSTIAGISGEEDDYLEVDLKIEVFRKS